MKISKTLAALLLVVAMIVTCSIPCLADDVEPFEPEPDIEEYNNTNNASASFYYSTTDTALKAPVSVTGYSSRTTAIHISVNVERLSLLAIYLPYASQEQTINNWYAFQTFSFNAPADGRQYRATITITVSGTGGADDVITFVKTTKAE